MAQAALEAKAWTEAKRLAESGDRTFTAKYRDNPARFVGECIQFYKSDGPTPYQLDTLVQLPAKKRVSVRGPHGLGKTALAAWTILWFALTREADGTDWKIPITASAWRQLSKFLMPELHKWARRINWSAIGWRGPFNERLELLTLSLKLQHGEAFALASDDPTSIEGAHASSLLYVFDESKAIPDDIWDAAEGAFASPDASESLALAISTPGEPQGRFYDIHARKPGYEDWTTRHVTLEEAIACGRISREWAEQRERQWGATSAVYQNRVLGEFASSEEEGVIPLAWVELANQRWLEWADAGKPLPAGATMTCVGVDVADSGEDQTVLALRYDAILTSIRRYSRQDTMGTVGRVVGVLKAHGGKAVVDGIGMGAGVVSRLRELKRPVVPFIASRKSMRLDKSRELGFADLRAEAWWNLRELLEDGDLALPPDDMLTGDLTAPKWSVQSGGKVRVESKVEIKKRLGRSTDTGDAVVQAFWHGATAGGVWRG